MSTRNKIWCCDITAQVSAGLCSCSCSSAWRPFTLVVGLASDLLRQSCGKENVNNILHVLNECSTTLFHTYMTPSAAPPAISNPACFPDVVATVCVMTSSSSWHSHNMITRWDEGSYCLQLSTSAGLHWLPRQPHISCLWCSRRLQFPSLQRKYTA